MCYHISFEVKLESILDYFPETVVDSQITMDFPSASYINGFDHKMHAAMYFDSVDRKNHLTNMMWGYLPNYIQNWEQAQRFWNGYKNEKGQFIKGFTTLNVIGEEILEKKMWRESALKRRCIIFVDGFYEWRHIFPIGKKGQQLKTAVKYPYHIFSTSNETPFTMLAGIFNPWTHTEVDKDTGEVTTETILTLAIATAKANTMMEQIHNSKKRMPTILNLELAKEWLNPALSEERIIQIASNQFPATEMNAFTIPKDFQQCGTPKSEFHYDELPELVL
jgi:putative SOS response-associated peptidase YedK